MRQDDRRYLISVLWNWKKELVQVMTKNYHHAKKDEKIIRMRTLYKKEIATCDRILREIKFSKKRPREREKG